MEQINNIDLLENRIISRLEKLYQNDIGEIASLLDMDYGHVYNIVKVRKSIPKDRLIDFAHIANYRIMICNDIKED